MKNATRKRLLGSATLIVLLGVLFAWGTHRASEFVSLSIIAESEETSLHAAIGFANTASDWILADSIDHLERGVVIMLLGSTKYVQIDYQDQLLIDGRAEDWKEVALPSLSVLPAQAIVSTFILQGRRIVETTIPLRDRAFTIGFVRIGTYSQLLESRLLRSDWTIGAVGFALWLLSLTAIYFTTVRLARRAALIPNHERLEPLIPIRELFAQRPIVIDLQTKTISSKGVTRLLTPKPFGLLSLLLSDSSRVFSDREIIEAIWPECRYTSANDVHQCVYRLRKLLNEIEPDLGSCITNVKGFGYRFESDARVGFEGLSFERANAQ